MGDLQPLQCQFQLLDLAGEHLRPGPELLALERCDLQAQGLHQEIMRAQTALQLKDQRLQGFGIIRQGGSGKRHVVYCRKMAQKSMKTTENDDENYIRAGALVQRGWHQSIPSHSIAICAGVSATLPAVAFGQGIGHAPTPCSKGRTLGHPSAVSSVCPPSDFETRRPPHWLDPPQAAALPAHKDQQCRSAYR